MAKFNWSALDLVDLDLPPMPMFLHDEELVMDLGTVDEVSVTPAPTMAPDCPAAPTTMTTPVLNAIVVGTSDDAALGSSYRTVQATVAPEATTTTTTAAPGKPDYVERFQHIVQSLSTEQLKAVDEAYQQVRWAGDLRKGYQVWVDKHGGRRTDAEHRAVRTLLSPAHWAHSERIVAAVCDLVRRMKGAAAADAGASSPPPTKKRSRSQQHAIARHRNDDSVAAVPVAATVVDPVPAAAGPALKRPCTGTSSSSADDDVHNNNNNSSNSDASWSEFVLFDDILSSSPDGFAS
ncbi:Uncharacterized protein PBTT_08528 [Plasmodiophora brassicae]